MNTDQIEMNGVDRLLSIINIDLDGWPLLNGTSFNSNLSVLDKLYAFLIL